MGISAPGIAYYNRKVASAGGAQMCGILRIPADSALGVLRNSQRCNNLRAVCWVVPKSAQIRSVEATLSMTTISPCILNNLTNYLHSPMPNSSWESACPSATRVGVRRPELFDN